MTLSDPRTPVMFGAAIILLFAGYLTMYYPMPASLSSVHAGISELSNLQECTSCHHEDGLATGCLQCHEEIRGQLTTESGYHHYMLDGKEVECASCHAEHVGRDFQLVNTVSWGGVAPEIFQHPHVSFGLEGEHDTLTCEECHDADDREAFHLSTFPERPRENTFLGLNQDCIGCHEDIHSDGLSGACDLCHGQEAFRPVPHFDHAEHFPLDGGHERAECDGCHLIPKSIDQNAPSSFPFDKVRGTLCAECHDSAHRTDFLESCNVCHPRSAPLWVTGREHMTVDFHSLTGFRLVVPHAEPACEDCHEPGLSSYEERYPSPSTPGNARTEETCERCHEDAHKGQFAERYDHCRDCHHKTHFLPHNFGQKKHEAIYPIVGAHLAVPCRSCHDTHTDDVRQFVGTSGECKLCHENPHGRQFDTELQDGDCIACHEASSQTFAIRPFAHEELTDYPLTGAHAEAECADCHLVGQLPPKNSIAGAPRIYRGTPTLCSACHKDHHRGQFRQDGQTRCASCHTSTSTWEENQFDHNTQSRFKLDGVHQKVPCNGCHFPVKTPDSTEIIQYKPLRMECQDCHEIVPE